MTADLERQIAQRLANGPKYIKSFRAAQPRVKAMVARGLLAQHKPPTGSMPNMVSLTDAGRALLGQQTAAARESSLRVRRAQKQEKVARLADLLAEGFGLDDAAAQMGMSKGSAEVYLREMRQELGWQAQ